MTVQTCAAVAALTATTTAPQRAVPSGAECFSIFHQVVGTFVVAGPTGTSLPQSSAEAHVDAA